MLHKSVLLTESLEYLGLKEGDIAVDGTLGSAGHSQAMLQAVGKSGRLIALDRDTEAISRCQAVFGEDTRVTLHNANYADMTKVLDSLNIPLVNAVLLDIGFSSDQLEDPERGFSFEREGPLDMRLGKDSEVTAADLVNGLSEWELAKLFWELGEERNGRRYAQLIVQERQKCPIRTTLELVKVLEKSLPKGFTAEKGNRPFWLKRHPATKVFQALRIAVNGELDALRRGLPAIWKRVKPGGRLVVISFHSLEDRIVKHQFLEFKAAGTGKILTKKPILAKTEEQDLNPRSRSAKLRAVEKI